MGVRGAWHSVNPPPPDRCMSCGAVAASDVIQMNPTHDRRRVYGPTSGPPSGMSWEEWRRVRG